VLGSAFLLLAGSAGAAPGKPRSLRLRPGTAVRSTRSSPKAGAVLGRPGAGTLGDKHSQVMASAPAGFTFVNSGTLPNTSGALSSGQATCPGGTVAWGGGVVGESTSIYQTVHASYPLVSSGVATAWVGYVNNASPDDSSFVVYAVCAAKPKKYSVQSASATNRADAQDDLVVTCPVVNSNTGKRSKALGGGGVGASVSLFQAINSSYPGNDTSWTVDMNNRNPGASVFAAYVICGKPAVYKRKTGTFVVNPPGDQTQAVATCPGGTVPSGGGVASTSSETNVSLNSTYPTGSGWGSFENNGSGTSYAISTRAVCVG